MDNKILTIIGGLCVVLIVLIVFRKQFTILLTRFASGGMVRFGKTEIHISDLPKIIYQREILKIGIIIATSDGKFNQKEMDYLKSRAVSMKGNPENLPIEDRKNIISVAIEVAAADEDFTNEEYKEILNLGQTYKIPSEEIDGKILTHCKTVKIDPPPDLVR